MQSKTLKLTDNFINILINLPETGMGYQLVKVVLKNGTVLRKHKVLNAELLMLDDKDMFNVTDILKIEIETKNGGAF